MALLVRLRRWLSVRRTAAGPVGTFDRSTQVGRRALALGLIDKGDEEGIANRLDQAERRLVGLHEILAAARADGAAIAHRLSRLRTAIVEVLEEPHGLLSRELRHWPERSNIDRETLAALLESLTSLADDAEQSLLAAREVAVLRERFRDLESRYASDVSPEWQLVVTDPRLDQAISNAWSATSIAAIKHDLGMLAEFFEGRRTALAAELGVLQCYVGNAGSTNSDMADGLDAEVANFSELARQRMADSLENANEVVSTSSADHLVHLGRPLKEKPANRRLSSNELEQREKLLRKAGDARWSRRARR